MMISAIRSTTTLLFIILLSSTLLKSIPTVDAFPSAAGHCLTGSLTGKGSGHGEWGGGPLANGQLQVKIGGVPVTSYFTTKLNPNQEYSVSLSFTTTNPNFFFRGLLFRLSGKNGEDASGTFYVGSDGNVQLKSGCASDVSAMTHNSRSDKTSVSFNFEYTASTYAELLLEVTVVRERAADNWFYSAFNLQVGEAPVVTTDAPSEGPYVCQDSPFAHKTKVDGKKSWETCTWVAEDTSQRCDKIMKKACAVTCNKCNKCFDSKGKFKFYARPGANRKIKKDCNWVNNDLERCDIEGMSVACRKTCGSCA